MFTFTGGGGGGGGGGLATGGGGLLPPPPQVAAEIAIAIKKTTRRNPVRCPITAQTSTNFSYKGDITLKNDSAVKSYSLILPASPPGHDESMLLLRPLKRFGMGCDRHQGRQTVAVHDARVQGLLRTHEAAPGNERR